MAKVKTKKFTSLILLNGMVSEAFMKRLGFKIGCIDSNEIHYSHKRILNAEEKKVIRDKIAKKAIQFYNDSVEELKVYVRQELVDEDVWITANNGKHYTPEEINGGELLSDDDQGNVKVKLQSGKVVVLNSCDLDFE